MKFPACSVPSPPTNPTAAAVGPSQINVSWIASSGAASYKVERSLDGTTNWALIATPISTAYSDTGLTAGTTYYYRVRASNGIGDSPPSSVTSATTAAWVASYSVAATPTSWAVGETKTYTITVTNTGFETWPAGGSSPVHLGIHFANTTGGFASNTWYTDQRFLLGSDLASGATATFTVAVTAPGTTGNLFLEYQVVKEGQFWFPQFSDVSVSVLPLWAASYSVGATPTSWAVGETKTYTITVTNTGSQTWPAGGSNPVHLGIHFTSTGGGTALNWYTDQRFLLGSDLASGATATFTVAVTAPGTTGNLFLEYQVVKEGQFWFPQFSDVSVSVH
jgi:hypothetical protein